MPPDSPFIKSMSIAAQAGGAVLKKYFGESLETIQKSTAADFKTKADIESETAILQVLTAAFPRFNILSEEAGVTDQGSEYTFVIDPLDGTNNFVLGVPNFSVSIGLIRNEELIAGVVFVPLLGHTYASAKGQGAFLNQLPLQVNRQSDWQNATINHICGYESDFNQELNLIRGLYAKQAKRISSNWSAAFDFCLLAAGRIEAVVNAESAIHDFAAGKLIAREAGALITDLEGNPETSDKNPHFVASNGTKLHHHLIEVIRQASRKSV